MNSIQSKKLHHIDLEMLIVNQSLGSEFSLVVSEYILLFK